MLVLLRSRGSRADAAVAPCAGSLGCFAIAKRCGYVAISVLLNEVVAIVVLDVASWVVAVSRGYWFCVLAFAK